MLVLQATIRNYFDLLHHFVHHFYVLQVFRLFGDLYNLVYDICVLRITVEFCTNDDRA